MGEAELNIDLKNILKVAEVQVVQSLDVGALQQALSWIVDKLNAQPASVGPGDEVQKAINDLLSENQQLRDQLQRLQKQQDDFSHHLGIPLSDAAEVADAAEDKVPSPWEVHKGLPDRMKALEDKLAGLGPHAPVDKSSDSTEPGTAAAGAAEVAGQPLNGSMLDDLNRRLAELEQTNKDLLATAAAMDELRRMLAEKPNHDDLDALRKHMDGKADRAELDALLQPDSGSLIAGGAAGSGDAAVSLNDDGSVDNAALVEAVNRGASDVNQLKALLLVLQERLNNKADAVALETMHSQLAQLKSMVRSASKGGRGAAAAGDGGVADGEGVGAGGEGAGDGVSGEGAVDGAGGEGAVDEAVGEDDVLASGRDPGGAAAAAAAAGGPVGLLELSRALAELLKRVEALERAAAAGIKFPSMLARHSTPGTAASGAAGGPGAAAAAPAAEDVTSSDGAAAAAAAAAVDAVSSLEDLRPLLKELYALLEGKANTADLADLLSRMDALAHHLSAVGELPGAEGNRSPAAAGPAGGYAGAGARAGSSGRVGAGGPVGYAGSGGEGGAGGEDSADRLGALEAALAALQDLLMSKADSDRVSDLESALPSKADQSALDDLRMRLAVMAASGEQGAEGGSPLDVLNGLFADKVGRGELDALRDQVALKAHKDDLDALAERLISSGLEGGLPGAGGKPVSKEELDALAQQVGENYAELERLRMQVSQLPREAPLASMIPDSAITSHGAGHSSGVSAADSDSIMKVVSALAKELQVVKDQIDMVAHASNILAVGLEPRAPSAPSSQMNGAAPGAALPSGSAAGQESRVPKGAYERLIKLLGRQGVNHKMDFFDPEVLNKMAQKLAAVDALVKNPGFGRPANGPDMGMKDLESQMRRLAKDMRTVKERMGEAGFSGFKNPDSDHAMLAGRPVGGYRCLACDRPLEKLDERPGPYIPTYQMPVKVPAAPDTTVKQVTRGLMPEPSTGSVSGRKKVPFDPSQRGPQSWYEDSHGAPADALPKEDVGPKLPPGGWRGSTAGQPVKGMVSLPDIHAGGAASQVRVGSPSQASGPGSGQLPQI
mmetsp:Transcript_28874/g.63614  ORF Transcript_28874/g.63614 Transcript_28874/m.63614 type:complete len:1064 (-) Transcript_28874:692-3883(-)